MKDHEYVELYINIVESFDNTVYNKKQHYINDHPNRELFLSYLDNTLFIYKEITSAVTEIHCEFVKDRLKEKSFENGFAIIKDYFINNNYEILTLSFDGEHIDETNIDVNLNIFNEIFPNSFEVYIKINLNSITSDHGNLIFQPRVFSENLITMFNNSTISKKIKIELPDDFNSFKTLYDIHISFIKRLIKTLIVKKLKTIVEVNFFNIHLQKFYQGLVSNTNITIKEYI